jgi:hypothetical protein
MMNTNNTSSAPTATGRRCTWGWPPCQKWAQNNVNRLCASHNTRFNNGDRPQRPVDPTSANDTSTTAHTATPTTKKTKKKMKEKEKKTHKGKRALEKRKINTEKERLRKREARSRREKGKKAHKAKNAAEKKNVKKRDDEDDTGTSTEGRKSRKMGEKARKKAAKQQSTKKKAARSSSPSSSSSSSQSIPSSSSSSVNVSSLSSSDKEKRKKRMKQRKKANKKREDNWKGDRKKSDDEAQKQRAVVVGQESRAPPESESIDMFKQLHNHINNIFNQVNEHIRHMYQLLHDMQGKIDYVVARQHQNVEFNCNASLGGSFAQVDIDDTQEDYGDNSRNGPKVGDANSARLKRGRGLPLRYNSNLPPSTPSKPKNQEIASRKPKKRKTTEETEDVGYYKSFPERKRGEPATVFVGAYAGLKNSNVNCYSNAILQCIASCFCLSDFSPSEEHPEFTLNHAFASLMRSMVGSEEIIDPSPFMSVFMSLFQPMVGEDNEVTKTEEGGTYYDFAWTTC